MLFASNRRFNEGLNPDNTFPRTVTFARGDNEPLQQFFCCRREADGKYTEIGSSVWFELMKTNSSKHVLSIYMVSTHRLRTRLTVAQDYSKL